MVLYGQLKINNQTGISIWDHILSIVWLYLMLFPDGAIFNLSVPLLLLLLFNKKQKYSSIITPLIGFLIVTLLVNLGEPYMDFKPIVRIITFAIVFYTFASSRGNRILFPYILFAAVYIFLSQISAPYHIPFLEGYFETTYEISKRVLENYQWDVASLNADSLSSGGRNGGIYINPNNCASYMSVLYATALCEIDQLGKNRNLIIAFVLLVAISFLFTGSRTAIIVFVAMSLYYMHSQGKGIKKYVLISALFLVALIIIKTDSFTGMRIFKVEEGMNDSFSGKIGLFLAYLNNEPNFLHFIFGAGDIAITEFVLGPGFKGTDNDLGNIFLTFGIIFYFAYICVNYKIFKILLKDYRVIYIVMLWCFSNSILISYRMCPVFFLALGLLYRRSIQQKQLKIK